MSFVVFNLLIPKGAYSACTTVMMYFVFKKKITSDVRYFFIFCILYFSFGYMCTGMCVLTNYIIY